MRENIRSHKAVPLKRVKPIIATPIPSKQNMIESVMFKYAKEKSTNEATVERNNAKLFEEVLLSMFAISDILSVNNNLVPSREHG